MDFLSAVRALENGECEGIRRVAWLAKDLMLAKSSHLSTVISWNVETDRYAMPTSDNILAYDWELVNPIPLTEEVEVKRWIIRSSSLHMFHEKVDAEDFCKHTATPKSHIIEMSGVDHVPVKPKVTKRGVYGGAIYADGIMKVHDPCNEIPIGKPLKLQIEWEE